MGQQTNEYRFDEPNNNNGDEGGFLKFVWNSDTKEFCGRDGASWGKVSLFYAIFYACLGSFFVGMLAVFVSFMPRDKPTYYGETSTMSAKRLNPGLGFRPQIDVEDNSIIFNPAAKVDKNLGNRKYIDNLRNFLNAKYGDLEDQSNVFTCSSGQNYNQSFEEGKACSFDYKKIFDSTPCTEKNNFGYDSNAPCVLIKLNKIITWYPSPKNETSGVGIRCQGETSADRDNIKKITYHSEDRLGNLEGGILDIKYYPYFAQKSYRAPFVFVQFEVNKDTLVNVECKAEAANIDNEDRLNRRGQTKFSLFVGSVF